LSTSAAAQRWEAAVAITSGAARRTVRKPDAAQQPVEFVRERRWLRDLDRHRLLRSRSACSASSTQLEREVACLAGQQRDPDRLTAAGADDCVATKKLVRLLKVDRSLIDDCARWLAVTDLHPAVVPAPLTGLVQAVTAARPEELSRNDPVPDTAAERQAAVLILIATDRADVPDVLLQQRAPNLRDHAGEVAFPGGARESGDIGPPATAIREAAEETGVDPAAVMPLILLPRLHIPPSRFDVTGVLAHWRTPSPVSAIDPGETNRVMRVPFTALADPDNRIMLSTNLGWHGPAFVVDGAVVWGYTGEILAALLRLGGWERPWSASSPIDLDQAWRLAG
jgi:8-oxo-dGTP pyrophosphatase MutT (NUDIX family)